MHNMDSDCLVIFLFSVKNKNPKSIWNKNAKYVSKDSNFCHVNCVMIGSPTTPSLIAVM